MRTIRRATSALALVAIAAPAGAQVANPSAAALGMGDNYTAVARGYAAGAWNPALLGMPGNPGFSIAIAPFRGIFGVDPITLDDLADYEDTLVPDAVKRQWLADIEAEGGQEGTGGFDATWLAIQVGPVALQASSSATALANLSPGMAELVMFGNVAEDGTLNDISFDGAVIDASAYSTFSLAYGQPVPLAEGLLSLGFTAKYTVGHFLGFGNGSTGIASVDPLRVDFDFPMVHSALGEDEFEINAGSGFGVDLGAAYQEGDLVVGFTIQNVINNFEWDPEQLRFRPLSLHFDQDQTESNIDEQPLDAAPADLLEAVDDLRFKPLYAVGAAYHYMPELTFSADARFGSNEGIATGASRHLGAGVEYRPLSWLPLRAGAALVSLGEEASGYQISGGFGLHAGPMGIAFSAARRETDLGTDSIIMFNLISAGLR